MTEPSQPARSSRSIRLVQPPDPEGIAVFSVRIGRQTTYYTLREMSCEIGGRGFAVHRLGLGTLYHVRIGKPEECSCECLGFLSSGSCKHILGLQALIRRRQL